MTFAEAQIAATLIPFIAALILGFLFPAPQIPRLNIPVQFIAGAATAFVALVAEGLLWPVVEPLVPHEYSAAVEAFIVVAFVEEIAKVALISGWAAQRKIESFRSLALVGAAVGAGFAAAENSIYVFHEGPSVVIGRLLTSTPFHIFSGVVAAQLLWLGIMRKQPAYIILAVIVVVMLHGVYDYFIISDAFDPAKSIFSLTLTTSLAIGLLKRGH